MTHLYILDGKTPVGTDDVHEWAKWFEANHVCYVNKTKKDGVTVSTVFLAIDHQWHPDEQPELFETMVFEGEHDSIQERYATWDEAEAGHKAICDKVFK